MFKGVTKGFIPFLLVLAFTFGVFLVNEYSLITADKIAIVVGLGLDKEGDEYLLSAQVVIPPSAVAADDKTNNTILKARGSTVSEALSKLFSGTGWYPKLNFCNLIALSKECAEDGALSSLEYFLRSEKVMDSCVLVVADKSSSEDVLKASTPLDNVSSYTLQKVLFEKGTEEGVVKINIKDFNERVLSGFTSILVPTASVIKDTVDSSEKDDQSAIKKGYELFDLSSTAVFEGDRLVHILSGEDTRTFNLIDKRAVGTFFSFETYDNSAKGNATYTLEIIGEKRDISCEFIDGVPTFTVDLNFKVKKTDGSILPKDENGNVVSLALEESALKDGERALIDRILTIFSKAKENGLDLFGVGEKLNKFDHKTWKEYITYDNYYAYAKDINYRVNVELSVLKEDKP